MLLDELPPAAIEALVALAGPGSGSPLAVVELRQTGGALARRAPGHGAVAGVDGRFVFFTVGMALDAEMAAFMLGHAGRHQGRARPLGQHRGLPQLRRGGGRHRRDLRRLRLPALAGRQGAR